MPTFTPPTTSGRLMSDPAKRSRSGAHALWHHYGAWETGMTVWQDEAGTWHESLTPYVGGATHRVFDGGVLTSETGPDAGLDTAQVVYLGGHVHEVSDAEAAALTTAGYGDRLNLGPVDLTWSDGQQTPWTRRVITQDGDNAITLDVVDSQGVGVHTGSSALASNQREWWEHDHTTGWTDVEASTIFDPRSFGGGINPQHGLAFRTSTSGGYHQGILVWHDVAFGIPAIINVGVWKTPDDGSSGDFRSTNFWATALPLGANVYFPYRLDVLLAGTSLSCRVYPTGGPVPDYTDTTSAMVVDLDSFGNTTTYPTPTSGACAVFLAHSGTDTRSWARLGPTTFRRYTP